MGYYDRVWLGFQNNQENLRKQQEKLQHNKQVFKDIAEFQHTLKGVQDFSTGWTSMDFLADEDDRLKYVYKQWAIRIISASNDEIEDIANLLIPNLQYRILYRESVESEHNFYNSGRELKSTDFFEIKNQDLILNVSTSIERYFDVNQPDNFFVPEVNLQLKLRNLRYTSQ